MEGAALRQVAHTPSCAFPQTWGWMWRPSRGPRRRRGGQAKRRVPGPRGSRHSGCAYPRGVRPPVSLLLSVFSQTLGRGGTGLPFQTEYRVARRKDQREASQPQPGPRSRPPGAAARGGCEPGCQTARVPKPSMCLGRPSVPGSGRGPVTPSAGGCGSPPWGNRARPLDWTLSGPW